MQETAVDRAGTSGRRSLTKPLILLLGLTLTGFLALLTYSQSPPTYQATASIVLLPGKGDTPDSGNPFIFLTGLSQARDVLIKIANSDSTRADLVGDSGDLDYVVEMDYTATAPIVVITAIAPARAKALALKESVLEQLSEELDTLQAKAGAPEGSRITPMVLTNDDEARQNMKAAMRGLIAAVILGLGLTYVAMAGFEAFGARRRGHGQGVNSSHAPVSTPHVERGGLENTSADGQSSGRSDPGADVTGSAGRQLLHK